MTLRLVALLFLAGGCGTWISSPDLCPPGYLFVRGDPQFKTNDFCVMATEGAPKRSSKGEPIGSPLNSIAQITARAYCFQFGQEYRLIKNSEWMTIAADIVQQPENWSGKAVGVGVLNRGHSDQEPEGHLPIPSTENSCEGTRNSDCEAGRFDQKRSHKLSTGQRIWDLSGNLAEWVDFEIEGDKPKPTGNDWYEYTHPVTSSKDNDISLLRPVRSLHSYWLDDWNSQQGIGQFYPGEQGVGGALLRGGSWIGTLSTGIFNANLGFASDAVAPNSGARCVFIRG